MIINLKSVIITLCDLSQSLIIAIYKSNYVGCRKCNYYTFVI